MNEEKIAELLDTIPNKQFALWYLLRGEQQNVENFIEETTQKDLWMGPAPILYYKVILRAIIDLEEHIENQLW